MFILNMITTRCPSDTAIEVQLQLFELPPTRNISNVSKGKTKIVHVTKYFHSVCTSHPSPYLKLVLHCMFSLRRTYLVLSLYLGLSCCLCGCGSTLLCLSGDLWTISPFTNNSAASMVTNFATNY